MPARVLPGAGAGAVQTWPWTGAASAAPEQGQAPELYTQAAPPSPTSEVEQLRQEMAWQQQRLQAALDEARAAGRAEGEAAAAARLEAVLDRMSRTIQELVALRSRVRREAEEDLLRLALAIARKLLHRQLVIDPDALLALVRAALDRISGQEVHRIRLHPQDVAAVRSRLDQLGVPPNTEIAADPTLERGAAILECTRGVLDASVSAQLAEVERGFADLLRERTHA